MRLIPDAFWDAAFGLWIVAMLAIFLWALALS